MKTGDLLFGAGPAHPRVGLLIAVHSHEVDYGEYSTRDIRMFVLTKDVLMPLEKLSDWRVVKLEGDGW